eukprot:m.40925 g.40925  ORF g.40925 m.40925 type:complete len:260 (-) comp9723_c0_seq1:1660-2439(-)
MLQRLKWIAGVCAFIYITHSLANSDSVKEKAQEFLTYTRERPVQGWLVYTLLSTAVTVSGIPFNLHDQVVAYVYPFKIAVAMIFVAKSIGSLCCYMIAKSFLTLTQKKSLLENEIASKILKLISSNPVYYGTLLRLATVPTFVKNYGLAIMDISVFQYFICCAIGSTIFIPIQVSFWYLYFECDECYTQVFVGSTLAPITLGLASADSVDKDLNTFAAISLVGILSLVLFMRKLVRVLLDRETDDSQGSSSQTPDKKQD